MRKNVNILEKGITLVTLVITIIVLLILAGITIATLTGENGILTKTIQAQNNTVLSQEEEIIKLAVSSIQTNFEEDINVFNLQEELQKNTKNSKVTINADESFNILFEDTSHNFNLKNNVITLVDSDNTMAIFDIGSNVVQKIYSQAIDGVLGTTPPSVWNLSINAIKRTDEKPDLSNMTDANIVSWTDAYKMYEQNPDAYASIIPEGTTLCPIYIWFEESGHTEIRDLRGNNNLTSISNPQIEKEVITGTIYWWSESNNVFLNFDSSYMFANMPYLSDISGLKGLRTDYCTNMTTILSTFIGTNKSLKDVSSLINWNTSNVTDMKYAFAGNVSLNDINPLKYWNTSKVTNMCAMFGGDYDYSACKLTSLTALKNWDVSKVLDMSYMFFGCNTLTDVSAINDWNITNVTDFTNMFPSNIHPEFTKISGTWSNGTFIPQ